MFVVEKEQQKVEDHSMSVNSEKDFKELIDEIEKVRHETTSKSETDEKSKELNTDSAKSQSEEEKSSTENINKIPEPKGQNNNLDTINLINQPPKNDLDGLNEYQKNQLLSMINSINLNNYLNNIILRNKQFNQFKINQIGNEINNINCINNQNFFRNDINNPYCYINNNNINFGNKNNSFNNNYCNNCPFINSELINNNLGNNNCFNNNNVNNNLIISILKNQLLNELKKKQIQENISKNINYPCNYQNNFNNNNNNINIFLQNEIQNQLTNLAQNNNNIYQYLLLLNTIKNNKINECLNSINNNPHQNDLNCFNINNININNQIQLNPLENNNQLNQIYINKSLFSTNQNKMNNNVPYKNYSNKKSANAKARKKFNQKSELDITKNQINLMNIFLCEDNRTTLMIKNIPNKYTISSFLEEINIYFYNTYDVFYLPIDYVNKCNLGFAFINFVEPLHIILFYELYRGKKWKKFKSDKICELLYAKFQNKKELISHFEKGKVLFFESLEKRPLILPTPKILPKINIPLYYLNLFTKLYPNISYEIKEFRYFNDKKKNEICNNRANGINNNNNIFFVFSIDGNFNVHKNN